MKRFRILVSILLAAAILLICCGCESGKSSGETGTNLTPENTSDARLDIISQDEYVLYQNIFYNDYAKSFDGKKVKKVGIFATLHDAYNEVDRYYVWGYYDNTKCCDWQWEFEPKEGQKLPPDGSLVTVEGTFVYDTKALDKYWIKNATVKTKTAYVGPSYDLNMYLMSDTLERVQIINIERWPDYFKGKTFSAYGRILSINTLQDPYFNESWEINFTWTGNVPAIGTMVLLTGTVQNGALNAESLQSID